MDNEQYIDALNTLFVVAVVASVFFLILSVVLFFLFKIPQIYALKTGKSKKKSIQSLKAQKSESGSLGQSSGSYNVIFGNSADLATAKISDNPNGTNNSFNMSVQNFQQQSSFEETSLLEPETIQANESYGKFVILNSVSRIHTNEIITGRGN